MTTRPELALIVAMDKRGLIGNSGALPWHLPADLRRFRQITMGHALIMGRKTFDSIGRCLPGRVSIVVTRRIALDVAVALVAHDWRGAVELIPRGTSKAFVVGGAEIYQLALPDIERMYVTIVDGEFVGDTYFPPLDWQAWKIVREEHASADSQNPYTTRFVEYVRIHGINE